MSALVANNVPASNDASFESICPCCPVTATPNDFMEEPTIIGLSQDEMRPFDENKHLDLTSPAVTKRLDLDMHYDSDFVRMNLPSSYGCCSAFKVLSTEGIRVLNLINASIEKYATTTKRIPKNNRGVTYRNQFLNDLAHSPLILRHVTELAGCEMIYHPMRIQQLHTNLKPHDRHDSTNSESKEPPKRKNVDRWHCDTTGFVLVLFCTDPMSYDGGELQYFNGTRDEGTALLASVGQLPGDRVLNVGTQHQGHGVFMQGCRVFHQVTPVLSGDERTTMVFSFQPRNVLALEACSKLGMTYNEADPLHVFIPDWVRYRAWKVMRRLEMWLSFEEELELNKRHCEESHSIIKRCHHQLQLITQFLPYSEDRHYFKELLEGAIYELRIFVEKNIFSVVNESNDLSCSEGKDESMPPRKVPRINCPLEGLGKCEESVAMTLRARHPNVGTPIPFTLPCDKLFFTSQDRAGLLGIANLQGAIADIDSCIDDILSLKSSAMEYF